MTAPTTPLKAVVYELPSADKSGWDRLDEKRVVAVTRASQVKSIRQRFAKHDEWPLEVLTLIAGRAGEGKSTIALHDLAKATRGELPGIFCGTPITVALTAIEDSKSLQKARLQAAGADLDNVVFIDMANAIDDERLEDRPSLPDDLPAIRPALIENDVRVWVIDPLSSAIPGDSNRRDDVRRALDPLHAMARDLGIAIVGILHFGKGAGRAGEKISGSHAFRDVARSVILVAQDEESGERIVSIDKSNYSSATGTSWKFGLEDTEVVTDDGEIMNVARVVELGASDVSVQDLLNRSADGNEGDDRNAAQAFIVDFLKAIDVMEAKAGDVLKAGKAAGFTDQELKNARRRCKSPVIESRKSSFEAGWVWGIDTDAPEVKPSAAPEGVTKVSKVSRAQNATPSTPSVTPSPGESRNARGVESENTPLDMFEEQF